MQRAVRLVRARTGEDDRSPGSETGYPAIGARYAQEWPVQNGQAEWYRETTRFVFAFFAGAKRFFFTPRTTDGGSFAAQ